MRAESKFRPTDQLHVNMSRWALNVVFQAFYAISLYNKPASGVQEMQKNLSTLRESRVDVLT